MSPQPHTDLDMLVRVWRCKSTPSQRVTWAYSAVLGELTAILFLGFWAILLAIVPDETSLAKVASAHREAERVSPEAEQTFSEEGQLFLEAERVFSDLESLPPKNNPALSQESLEFALEAEQALSELLPPEERGLSYESLLLLPELKARKKEREARKKWYDQVAPSLVKIERGGDCGSGVVVGEGLVLTAYHVFEGWGLVRVFIPRVEWDEEWTGSRSNVPVEFKRLVMFDRKNDLALIEISDHTLLKTITFAPVTPRCGDEVVAFHYAPDMRRGLVTATGDGEIEFSNNVYPGCSGGPIVNTLGQLVGLVTQRTIAERTLSILSVNHSEVPVTEIKYGGRGPSLGEINRFMKRAAIPLHGTPPQALD